MEILSEMSYKGCDIDVTTDGKIIIRANGEQREYQSPKPIKDTEQFNEYIFLNFENNEGMLQLKFEEKHTLIGDIFDNNEEFVDTFALHKFGE